MTRIAELLKAFDQETRTTRRHLERFADGHDDWRPHPKSMPAGELARHLVECIRWTSPIMTAPELDLDPATFERFTAASHDEILTNYDADVARCRAALAAGSDASLDEPWTFKVKGKQFFQRPRGEVMRDFVLNHLVHHRGQFSVYLRLLDIAVPATYGPTADEPF